MVGTTVVMWALGRRIGIRDRNMLRLYYGAPSMHETFSFARSVAMFTFLSEAVGALVLWGAFRAEGVSSGTAAWWGIFHAVSAFNNAGFSLTGRDMLPYAGNPVILCTLMLLIILGGIGFLPIITLLRRRSFNRLPLDNKLIFATSGVLLSAGMLFTAAVEWKNDQTLGSISPAERPLVALFQSTSARTAGFSAIDTSGLHDQTKLATIGLMFVGAAAGSTGGGLKVGAFSLLFAVMVATIRGSDEVSVFRRRIPQAVVQQATTLALYHVALLFGFTLALTFTANRPFIDILFEAQSAISTVGLSTVGTVNLGADGHFVLILAMLAGRFSPVMLVLYMTRPRRKAPVSPSTRQREVELTMNVAILGLGRFGSQLAAELVAVGVEVLAVDRQDARVNELAETATLAAAGDLNDFEFLQSLALHDYDAVVVAIGSDVATSVLLTLTLKKRLELRYVVAKASTNDHAQALRLAGADLVIAPEQEAAIRLAHTLGPSSHLQEYLSLGPTYGVAKLEAPITAVGRTIGSLETFTRHNVVLLAMVRNDLVTFRPDRDVVVEEGDIWLIAGEDEQLRKAGT
ncbi:MAG: hypothetical protein KatS3mg062_0023 [Tepidiforma sp.]|nr:MAG: hypothetical protein KatS3mg062_0023 [Tepidiforma sp.]